MMPACVSTIGVHTKSKAREQGSLRLSQAAHGQRSAGPCMARPDACCPHPSATRLSGMW